MNAFEHPVTCPYCEAQYEYDSCQDAIKGLRSVVLMHGSDELEVFYCGECEGIVGITAHQPEMGMNLFIADRREI